VVVVVVEDELSVVVGVSEQSSDFAGAEPVQLASEDLERAEALVPEMEVGIADGTLTNIPVEWPDVVVIFPSSAMDQPRLIWLSGAPATAVVGMCSVHFDAKGLLFLQEPSLQVAKLAGIPFPVEKAESL
jgi:hypothetical protein